MIDSLTPLFTYALALGVAAAIPGPGIAALVGQSLGSGLRIAVFFLAGIVLGDVTFLTLAVGGLAAFASAFGGALLLLKLLGGAYLGYLAVKLWRSEAGIMKASGASCTSPGKAFFTGFAITLGNPKAIIFYLALLPSVLDLAAVGFAQWLALCFVTLIVLVVTLLPYAVMAAGARHMFSSPRALGRLNRVAASVIGTAGALILGQAALGILRRAP